MDPELSVKLQQIFEVVNAKNNYTAAWIAFSGALAAVLIASITSIISYLRSRKDDLQDRILAERQKALFDALHVIDLVYLNMKWNITFDVIPQIHRERKWDIQLAHDAMNRILIYCAKPERVLKAFYRAVGMHNPTSGEEPPKFTAASINDFRSEVARELQLPDITFLDKSKSWIFSLPGSDKID